MALAPRGAGGGDQVPAGALGLGCQPQGRLARLDSGSDQAGPAEATPTCGSRRMILWCVAGNPIVQAAQYFAEAMIAAAAPAPTIGSDARGGGNQAEPL